MDPQDNASEAHPSSHRGSRATSPGGTWREVGNARFIEVSGLSTEDELRQGGQENLGQISDDKSARSRQRTLPYQRYLPYRHDDRELETLREIASKLYIAASSGDFVPGATHWTRELRGWIQLKFNMPREDRIKLARFYYELALAPGMERSASERFASMFMTLTKRKHYLRPGEDLYLDWRPMFKEFKTMVLPSDANPIISTQGSHVRTSTKTLIKVCSFAQVYFDPSQVRAICEEVLPYFSLSSPENAFAAITILNLMLPTQPAPADSKWTPQFFLPSIFHIWASLNRSRACDLHMIDLLSRLARDCLLHDSVHVGTFGMFTKEQAATAMSAALRLLDIPVSQVTSPYTNVVDGYQGAASLLDRDHRKHPVAHHIARWIVMSLTPDSLSSEHSMLSMLEGLIQAIETFYHPSNSGHWTRNLSQLIFYLADFFVMRWNREHSEEMQVPKERQLTEDLRRRFVLCLRDVTFLGIFAKSGTAVNYSLTTLQNLAYLEPKLILPGALQRIYPAMRGLVEVHRTTSSIRALFELTKIIARTKGFRCHLTTLLGLALPGIDANDLDKTLHTLTFMQAVFYEMPMCEVQPQNRASSDGPDVSLAADWITAQIERLEAEGVHVVIDYDQELSDADEENILASSTAQFHAFLSSFMESVFNLLRNLPDASRVKTGSPEESITNALPAAFTPMVSSMSAELYDLALDKLTDFVSKNTVYQARDALAYLCCSLSKVNPHKALSRLIPVLSQNIRTEVEENGAGLTRTFGSDVLPKDKALVFNISILAMSLVHVGSALVDFSDDVLAIARFMHRKCKGTAATHASNLLHHVLLTMSMTYTVDHSLFEEGELASGAMPAHWACRPNPQKLSIKWHYADQREVQTAISIFEEFATKEISHLRALVSNSPPIRRDGSGKDWSDEVSQSLVLFRLMLSGIAPLFDPRHDVGVAPATIPAVNGQDVEDELMVDADGSTYASDEDFSATEDEDVRPAFQYPSGYQLRPGEEHYKKVHHVREQVGHVLHEVHEFLIAKQQDDVTAFNALYATYKSWFIDVGFERSAHVLDRVTRLLAADIGPFKLTGLRKQYPRPLLVRRAYLYHLQRLRHNASPRYKTDLDLVLLKDLIQSCVSTYTEIRRTAQTAIESSMKVLIGARAVIIPPLLDHLETSVQTNDFPKIKGALYSLLFGSLAKPVGRDWRFTPSLFKTFLNVLDVDKVSVQKIATAATIQIMDMVRQSSRIIILDHEIISLLKPGIESADKSYETEIEKRSKTIEKRFEFIKGRRLALLEELIDIARNSHWRKESRTATLIIALGLRFDLIAPERMMDLVIQGAVNPHPSLRAIYQSALIGLTATIETRAVHGHKYENYLTETQFLPGLVRAPPAVEDPDWTSNFLAQFQHAEANVFVDQDYPGWLFWGKAIPSYKAAESGALKYDEVELAARHRIGGMLTRDWFARTFEYLKQEPRDANADRFRLTHSIGLAAVFSLVLAGLAPVDFSEIKVLLSDLYGDGSDKHQHRAMAEALSALINASITLGTEVKESVWAFAFPIVRGIFEDGITPENMSYWQSFLDVVLQNKDPRRSWPLVDWLASFRLDMSTSAAFKESSKITLLQHSIIGIGWHFQLDRPVEQNFLAHLDHPYKGVRDVMGQTLAFMHRTRYHESHKDLEAFADKNAAASTVGERPHQVSAEYAQTIRNVFGSLEQWRKERPAGQQTASSYTSGSKTVLSWLETVLQSFECTELLPFFSDTFLEALLHMMDIKEDPELQAHAYSVFRHLGNIPYRAGEEADFVEACIRIGRTAASWHQRLRIMINMQAVYFRHLFLMPESRQRSLFAAVSDMLEDTQHEVRVGAGTTLSGMIRCSPIKLRDSLIPSLIDQFTHKLRQHPTKRGKSSGADAGQGAVARHAAVLGLGALIQAFPYTSPPPEWIPGVLTTLATKAASDPGMVGKSAKGIVSDFKKTRQDTWHMDIQVFQPEQLEDLEGVLWKSYFA